MEAAIRSLDGVGVAAVIAIRDDLVALQEEFGETGDTSANGDQGLIFRG